MLAIHLYKVCHPQRFFYKSSSHIGSYDFIQCTSISKPFITPVNYDHHLSSTMETRNKNEYNTLIASNFTTEPPFPSTPATDPPLPSFSPMAHTGCENYIPTPTPPLPSICPIAAANTDDDTSTSVGIPDCAWDQQLQDQRYAKDALANKTYKRL